MGWVFQLLEMRRPVPSPFLTWQGCEEKEKLLERAAGVAESSGRIQVSVKPKMLSAVWEAIAGIRSALLTADWQFQRPTEKERGIKEEVQIERRWARLRLPSAFDVRALLWDNRNVLETHDTGGKKEARKGKEEINTINKKILKCVASFVARLKSRRKKSQVFTRGGWRRGLNASAKANWLYLNTLLVHPEHYHSRSGVLFPQILWRCRCCPPLCHMPGYSGDCGLPPAPNSPPYHQVTLCVSHY